MNRENLMQLYREYHLNDYQLRDIEDLEAIYQIDVNHLEGYRTLSDQNKQLFDKFIVRFTYSYKYEENTKREWLHVMSEREWY